VTLYADSKPASPKTALTRYAWLDKEKLLPPVPAALVQAGQDWELEIRKAVREMAA